VFVAALLLVVILAAIAPFVFNAVPGTNGAPSPEGDDAVPRGRAGIEHVFVINLENKGYDRVWGTESGAPYLSKTLRAQGVLLTQYYAIAPSSLPNYIAQISGQAANPKTSKGCLKYVPFDKTGTVPPGQAVGTGCVYPREVPTLASQLDGAGLTWKGYMEDMKKPCRHPVLGQPDDTRHPKVGDQYAARHNPFVYFEEITSSPDCARKVVDLSVLSEDLKDISTTPNLSYISPNMCNDGHDKPCVDGRHGGLRASNTWLEEWIPRILDSPAYREGGLVVITFDESAEQNAPENEVTVPGECCTPEQIRHASVAGGTGGGRVGALLLSPFIEGGTSSDVIYNHYSLLASIEDIFSLPYLGYAGAFGLNRFGPDVYNGG
jgi:hypothetical protein